MATVDIFNNTDWENPTIYLYPMGSKKNPLPIFAYECSASYTLGTDTVTQFSLNGKFGNNQISEFLNYFNYAAMTCKDDQTTYFIYSDDYIKIENNNGSLVLSGNNNNIYGNNQRIVYVRGQATAFYLGVIHTSNNAYLTLSLGYGSSTLNIWSSRTSNYESIGLAGENKGYFPDTYFQHNGLWGNMPYTDGTYNNLATSEAIRKMINSSLIYDPNAPYSGGDQPNDSPDGEFDYSSDDIPEPDLPTTSVTDSGFVSLYAPTEAQLKQLADYLWSDAFSLDTFKKLFNNPMDCILGLTIIPVNVPTGTAREITVGNIVSTVSCNTVTQQYIKVNCGTFTFSQSKFTGGYLDFSPYTKCYLYLPFIGTQEINIDEFMGATMQVTYHVDILTGAMFAYVIRISGTTKSVIYTFMGQCAENVPLSSTSYSNTIGSILNAGAAVGGVVATAVTGGAAAPVALGLLATASTATANAASSMKPSIQHSGSIGGGAGIMGVNYPYVIFIAPRTAYDQAQYKYTGLPNNKAVKLSGLSGFTIVQAINLSIDGATQQEINEIEAGLKEGVIL